MIEKIHWLGHASFKIANGQVIYVDPYKVKEGEKADIILITHDHFDHLSKEDVEKISSAETTIVAPSSSARKFSGDIKEIKQGDKINLKGIDIEVVAAYNIGKDFHPNTSDYVGYIVVVEGTRIYHAGDTDVIPEMKELKVDIALFPVGGTYTMTAKEAAEAAALINPKISIPMHWGSIVGSRSDAEEFAKLCTCGCEVKILEQE